MSKMRSFLMFEKIDDVTALSAAIEAVTRGRVVGMSSMFGKAYIEIEHHEEPMCPNCGKAIHAYGHGLCLSCWTIKSKELRGL